MGLFLVWSGRRANRRRWLDAYNPRGYTKGIISCPSARYTSCQANMLDKTGCNVLTVQAIVDTRGNVLLYTRADDAKPRQHVRKGRRSRRPPPIRSATHQAPTRPREPPREPPTPSTSKHTSSAAGRHTSPLQPRQRWTRSTDRPTAGKGTAPTGNACIDI